MMNKLIKIDIDDRVAIVRLMHGITNSIGQELVSELDEVLQWIRNNEDVKGMVLTSNNDKFFSIGFDIPQIFELPSDRFLDFFKSFNHLCIDFYSLPIPTIAAISGHATAGGCILALCCDYRFIANGRKLIGLNEIKLGVPVPYVADRMLYDMLGTRIARKIIETGEFFLAEEALDLGLIDEIHPNETLLLRAKEHVRKIMTFPGNAFANIKRYRTEQVVMRINESLENKENEFVSCWYTEETRLKLREAMSKF